jgi:hypothetical protein
MTKKIEKKINENLLDEFENAAIKRYRDEGYEYADPNRECADYARSQFNKIREKLLKHLNKE